MLRQSIHKVFKGAMGAFKKFPAAMLSALSFAIVTMIRIYLDWPAQEAYNFLFSCLHFAFALGAIFGLTAVTAERIKYNTQRTFVLANGIVGAVVLVAFGLLYYFGGTDPNAEYYRVVRVTSLAGARMAVATSVSYLVFVILAGYHKNEQGKAQFDFSGAFFMTHKAFFTALLYGLVIEIGVSGVAGAIRALLYRDMSYNIYSYIATIAGFVAFAIFAGYFPEFGQADSSAKREHLQKQPRFVEVLFEYIMIPIMLALTVVLLIWSARTIFGNEEVLFSRLSTIATSYAYFGIWLHIMTSKSDSGLAKFYRRVYPFAALIILAFEAKALWTQLSTWGLKTLEYSFILMWIFAVASVLLLFFKKTKAHVPMTILVCVLGIVSVLPIIGYETLPMQSQVNRLEKMLEREQILVNGSLIPTANEISQEEKIAITDTVLFLSRSEKEKLPDWFDTRLAEASVFEEKLGFVQTWEDREYPDNLYKDTYLTKPNGTIDIGSYDWVVNIQENKQVEQVALEGAKGSYSFRWIADYNREIPAIEVKLNDGIIVDENMNAYLDALLKKYPTSEAGSKEPSLEDMMVEFETNDIKILIVFRHISINLDVQSDAMSYWMELDAIYVDEK